MNRIISTREPRAMVQFISDWMGVDKYDIQPLFFKSYAKALTLLCKCHFSSNKDGVYSYNVKSFMVNTNLEPEQVKTEWVTFIEGKGMDYKDFVFYSHYDSVFRDFFNKTDKPNVFQAGINSNAWLVKLLLAIQGKINDHDGLEEANRFMKASRLKNYGPIDKINIGHLSVRTYLNCKMDVIGLTDEDRAKLDTLFDIHEKLKGL